MDCFYLLRWWIIGAMMTGIVADRLGRKVGLLWNNITILIGVILIGFAKPCGYYEMLIVGRFFVGINSGLNAGLTPMYLAEISPSHLRGAIGTVYQLVVTISILISQILGLGSLLGTSAMWPWLLSCTIIPAIFQVCTLPICPESPKFTLLNKGKEIEAQRALTWFRGTIEVHEELDEMRAEYEQMKAVPKPSLKEMFTVSLRMPLIISCMMMVAQQLSGINAVIFFSTKIFQSAGLTGSTAQLATLGMGAMNVVMTLVSLVIVEKAGRKTLLLFGFSGMFIDVFLLFLCILFKDSASWISYFSIILVVMFVVMFASGPGSIPWFLVSELFNSGARPMATSIAVAVNWTSNFIVGWSFLPLQVLLGPYVFIIFTVLLGLFVIFIWFKVPETKNKTAEEIAAMFRQRSYTQG
ncbi:Glucose transporter type 1 [Orchesella cincta]|uniref:Glucose transporter type 1 n=1 Tax=Orchesella cincta TaxID=48709 RepID=A0A1D2MR33_ORCCI|nr:Glucose transporter type 1 [Orchesella cincta]